MKEKNRPLEVKFNGQWHLVVGGRQEIVLDKHCSLPPFLELDNGFQIHPLNPNIEKIREVKGKRAVLYQAKKR
jgi:hypothetical protein